MGYVLGQYNYTKGSSNNFMSFVTSGVLDLKLVEAENGLRFKNLALRDNFNPNVNYYFHGQIRKQVSQQTIYIKLINWNNETDKKEQYIKTINIDGGEQWQDIEFIFTPIIGFDTLLFELQRTSADYVNPRKEIICFQELSIINNLLNESISADNLIKIGVQSNPSFMMCINGEEIHTPRSGIYELKSGVILVDSFSAIGPGKETGSEMQNWQNGINQKIDSGEEITDSDLTSGIFFGTSKTRPINSFTLDYVYKENE